MKNKICFILMPIIATASLLPFSCSINNDEIEAVIESAGDNGAELLDLLAKLKGDELKAAQYLIVNMPGLGAYKNETYMLMDSLLDPIGKMDTWIVDSVGKSRWWAYDYQSHPMLFDIEHITADYLEGNIRDAFSDWRTKSWNKSLGRNNFMELLLPYRSDDEMLTRWRETYKQRYGDSIEEISDVVEAARIIAERLGREYYRFNEDIRKPHRDALSLLRIRAGNCVDECDRAMYAMRANGIPSAIDGFFVSPDNGGSHRWNVLYDNVTKRFIPFNTSDNKPARKAVYSDYRRKGKVYRFTYGIMEDRIEQIKQHPHAPQVLRNLRIKDVTSEYFGSNHADLDVLNNCGEEVYLGIFTPERIMPIGFGERVADNKVRFYDIEPYVIYFPLAYSRESHGIIPIGNAFTILNDGTTHVFIPDSMRRECVKLTRKMPVRPQIKEWMEAGVVGMIIEGCNSYRDGDWTTLYEFDKPLTSNFNVVCIDTAKAYRYYRIVPSNGYFQLSEVRFFDDEECKNPINMRIYEPIDSAESRAVDGDLLTYYIFSPERYRIAFNNINGKRVRKIAFSPRNDDNYVWPGQEYELLYFDNGEWRSLGIKMATEHDIDFEAPGNAVLWLRNRTKGREEQVFVCVDGRQLFNMDLSAESFCGQE